MENNDLLEMVRSKAQGWLTKSYDAETRAQSSKRYLTTKILLS